MVLYCFVLFSLPQSPLSHFPFSFNKVSRNFSHPPQPFLTTFRVVWTEEEARSFFCFYIVVTSVMLGPARAKICVYPNLDHPIQSLNPLPIHIGLSSALEMSQNWGEFDINVHSKFQFFLRFFVVVNVSPTDMKEKKKRVGIWKKMFTGLTVFQLKNVEVI